MGEEKTEDRGRSFLSKFWNILCECAMPLLVFALFIGALGAGLFFRAPDLLPLASLLALPLLIAVTNLDGILCFILISSFFALGISLSGLEPWRAATLSLTFFLPSLLLMFYRGYPQRIGKMIARLCEESVKIDSMSGVCSLAVRMLRGSGFFKHIALLLWSRETDRFRIVAATGAYEIGTEIPSESTFYVKCHTTLKPARFRDPYSSIFFLPSKFKARSAICVPLHLGGRRFGVIVAESHFSRSWSRGSRQILQFFAAVLSYVLAEVEARDGSKRGMSAGKKPAFPAGKTT